MIATTCVQCGRPLVWNPAARLVEHGADRDCELPPRDVRGRWVWQERSEPWAGPRTVGNAPEAPDGAMRDEDGPLLAALRGSKTAQEALRALESAGPDSRTFRTGKGAYGAAEGQHGRLTGERRAS